MIDTKSAADFNKFMDALEAKIISLLDNYSTLKKTDLALLDAQLNLYQEMIDLGYETRVKAFFDRSQSIIDKALDMAEKAGVKNLAKISFDDIQFAIDKNYKVLLGKAEIWADQVESAFVLGMGTGLKPDELREQLKFVPLRDSQLNVVINTFYADVSRCATAKVFENDKTARFKYIGPLVEHSSEECKWLILNQKKEGYTKAEIDAGIETPYKYKSGELAGQTKKIYWSGRKPNFNCLHEWVVIDF